MLSVEIFFSTGMPLEQALAAVTINPAWQIRMKDKLGSP